MQVKCWTKKTKRSSALICFNLPGGSNLIQLVSFIMGAAFGKAIAVHMNDRRKTYTNDSPA